MVFGVGVGGVDAGGVRGVGDAGAGAGADAGVMVSFGMVYLVMFSRGVLVHKPLAMKTLARG